MSKVLVLYYSSYGHIEAMANAVAEGARQAGAQVDIKRVPELVPEEIARKSHFKLDQAAPVAKVDDLANYDAIIVGRHAVRPSELADRVLPRSGRRALDAWSLARQGRRCLHVDRDTAWRPGDYPFLDHHQPAALRNGNRGFGLWPCRPDDARRDHRRFALRRDDNHWKRRLTLAHCERTTRRTLPGSQNRRNCEQAPSVIAQPGICQRE